ncbi:TPA: hypothetical protein I7682_17995 [Vibrio vulnificus]|nr:hypothetical protein [Vibrio vulnificus]
MASVSKTVTNKTTTAVLSVGGLVLSSPAAASFTTLKAKGTDQTVKDNDLVTYLIDILILGITLCVAFYAAKMTLSALSTAHDSWNEYQKNRAELTDVFKNVGIAVGLVIFSFAIGGWLITNMATMF